MALYDKIDEETPDDADYIETPTPGSIAEVRLGPLTDPGVDTGHTFRVRAKGTGTLTTRLVQGEGGGGAIILPSRGPRKQPQGLSRIQWKNSLAEGLVFAYVGSNPIFHKAGGKWSIDQLTSAEPSDHAGIAGRYLNGARAFIPDISGVTPWTLATIVRRHADGWWGDQVLFAGDSGRSNSSQQILLSGGGLGDTTKQFAGFVWTGSLNYVYSGSRLTARKWSIVVLTCDGSTLTIATDDAPEASISVANAGAFVYPYLYVGQSAPADQVLVSTALAIRVHRAWSRDQRASFIANPWQLFAPSRSSRLISLPGAIATRVQALTSTPTTYEFALTEGEAAQITDYTDLRLRFEAN